MEEGNFFVELVKVVGFPIAVAVYYMVRDWRFMSRLVQVLTVISERLGVPSGGGDSV